MSFQFPVFLKFKNLDRFFKIEGHDAFEELQIMPNAYSLYHIKATQLPERNLIMDMLENKENRWEQIDEQTYKKAKAHCQKKLRQL